ncbi:MAG: serine/threonine protein kinase [Acidobacteria bacterium]|nr:serine/threonine protein kinase [Acidobacteriota bacterium]
MFRCVFLLAAAAFTADWPSWRGPANNGVSSERAPAGWTKEQVRWRTPLPEANNSTPIVWGGRVFLAQARKQSGERLLLCLDAASGKQLWQAGFTFKGDEPTHATNPYASASPVTDGKVVVAWFGSSGLAAFDFAGKRLWHNDLGLQRHTWGYGSSPVLHGDRVYLNFGPGDRSFLAAFDKKTGKQLWRYEIPKGAGKVFANWKPEDMYGSWASPAVITVDGKEQLIAALPGGITAFEPATGEKLWSAGGLGDLVYPSPVYDGGILYVSSGFSGPAAAVRPGRNATPVWQRDKTKNTIGTGVVHQGKLYTVDNSGVAECADMATGNIVWTGRLPGKGESRAVWSSPVLTADGKILVMNQSGEVFTLATGGEFKVLGQSALNEATNSSVVIAGGDLYLRTHEAIWRIGSEPPKK